MSVRRPALVTAGALGTAALALATSGTLSAFTASITNSTNTAGVGSLVMQETNSDGSVICNSTDTGGTSATCATINKYGGDLTMGTTATNGTRTQTIYIKNTGTTAASSFSLTSTGCTLTNPQSLAGDLCAKAVVTVMQDGVQKYTGSPAGLTSVVLDTANATAGGSSKLDITFSTVGLDDTFQGQTISQPLTWTFNA